MSLRSASSVMTEDEDTAFALQLDSSACVLDDRAYHGGLISSSAPKY